MSTIINGDSPSITFSDSSTQTTAFTTNPIVNNIKSQAATPLTFAINATEAGRFDANGNLLVGTTSGNFHKLYKSSSSDLVLDVANTSATSPYGARIFFSAADPNNATNYFLECNGNGSVRAQIRSNGGLANYSGNNVNLSDERTKTNIINAGNYLDKVCAIPVRTFKYKDQNDNILNIGVIAQEVEKIAPELVDNSGFGETPKDGIPLKAIYQTDFTFVLMKAIQELKAEFDTYKASHP